MKECEEKKPLSPADEMITSESLGRSHGRSTAGQDTPIQVNTDLARAYDEGSVSLSIPSFRSSVKPGFLFCPK